VACACGDGTGKLRRLVELVRSHGEAIDADFQHHYQLSVGDVVAGRVTWRRFGVLLEGLPAEGTAQWRYARRNPAPDRKPMAPPDEWWTADRDLMASLIDEVKVLIWLQTEDARNRRNYPKPIPRPGVAVEAPVKRMPPAQAAALLAAIGPSTGVGLDAGDGEHDQADGAEQPQEGTGHGEAEPALGAALGVAEAGDGQAEADEGQHPEPPQHGADEPGDR
jgi:hypothetical protein